MQRELEAAIDGEVRFDKISRALYSTDASVYQIEPLGVVIPRSPEAVIRAVEIAARHGVPITPRGGGTSQAGQSIGAGLVLDTSKHLNRILEINPDERWARVEPGVVLDELNAALRPHQLRFAPDVSSASRATVGGMMANNSSGARSVLYGKTIDHVLEQRVVLADGSLAHFRPLIADAARARAVGRQHRGARLSRDSRARRPACRRDRAAVSEGAAARRRLQPRCVRRSRRAPIDLTRIIVGSEGTLGFIVDAKIGLVPLPAQKAVLTIEFDHLLDALGATPLVLTHGPSAVEVMDDFILSHARGHPALDAQRRSMIQRDGSSLLCVEFYGDSLDELVARMEAVERDLRRRAIAAGFGTSSTCAQAGDDLELPRSRARPVDGDEERRQGDLVRRRHRGGAREAARLHRALHRASCSGIGTTAGVYAHASVGCLHVRPVVNLKTAAGVATFEAIANEVADLVLEFGGALSGEHGDGLVRGAFNEKMFGSELYQAFRAVKRTFDPNGLFNPGRIVDTPPITSHLRFGAGYADAVAGDVLRFLRARRLRPRGRDVQRRRAVPQDPRGHDVPVVHGDARRGALDARPRQHAAAGDERASSATRSCRTRACTRCSICASSAAPARASVPVGVDVARFKSEFLVGLLGSPRPVARARMRSVTRTPHRPSGSRFAPLSNTIANSAPVRWVMEQTIGVDRRRTLPQWTRQTLRKRSGSRDRGSGIRDRGSGIRQRACCSPTRSPNTPIRRLGSPRSTC